MRSSTDALFPQPLLDSFQRLPERTAFEQGSRSVSRAELLTIIRRLTSSLEAAGLGPGHGIASFTAVSPEAFAAHIAAQVLGCRVVGIRPGYTARQLEHVMGMQIDALLIDGSNSNSELVEASGSARLLSLGPYPGALDLLAHTGERESLTVLARPEAVAALYFTSGSTGHAKGCAMTYSALSAHWSWKGPDHWSPVACELAKAFERYLLFGTLASLVVMEFLALCLHGGGTAVIAEPDGRPLFPSAIERYAITGSIITVPRLYQMLDLLRDEATDVSSLRALMVSGSPISPSRLASAVERLGPVVYQGYGQTEAGSISMLTPADLARGGTRALASVGRPHPEVEINVLGASHEPLITGQTGEIHLKSAQSMQGYWQQPEETAEVLQHGWLCTRDLGYLDEHGFLHLVGRTRDVVLVNALVVYAGPIEQTLAAHPDVDQAYVVGTLDDQTGEAIHAFIVPVVGRTVNHDMLADLVRKALGADSVPKSIIDVEHVPLAPSGKPDKRALLELYPPTKPLSPSR